MVWQGSSGSGGLALLMGLFVMAFQASPASADTTDFHRNLDVVVKSIEHDGEAHRYYGIAYRFAQFGFVTFDGAVYATPEDVNLMSRPLLSGKTQSLKAYYGIHTSIIYALTRLSIEFAYLLGMAEGQEVQISGDTQGVCDVCTFSVNEASLALTYSLDRKWDLGIRASKLNFSDRSQPSDWRGRAFFIRYSW